MKPPPSVADTEPDGPEVDVAITPDDAWQTVPRAEAVVRRAIAAAAAATPEPLAGAEVAVLLCDDATIADLNGRWRGMARPTNVLSFPARAFGCIGARPLGDIAIAAETLTREAEASGKTVEDHLAHLAVHGFLHLTGHHHENDDEAEAMERLERDILARIGVADPYAAEDVDG